MIACFAWTNLQIINISNAKINLYPEEEADLYIRMGPHISGGLISAVKKMGIYKNVYTIDPIVLSYGKMRLGSVPVLKYFLLKRSYIKAYNALMDNTCPARSYSRVLMTWFYAENAFVLNYWARHTDHLAITLVDEGTGSYCYFKKELYFPMFMANKLKDRLRKQVTEGAIARKLAKNIDSIALYKPEYCREDIDYKKLTLPTVSQENNPVIYKLLISAAGSVDPMTQIRYDKSRFIYFSLFSPEGESFDATSNRILRNLIQESCTQEVIAKVHTGNPVHAQEFARELEDRIFVDRQVYVFEGLYAQLDKAENMVLVSCASTAAINPKFMFNQEPYVIFTYRLYDTYRQCGVERDDWIASALKDAYDDKSRVMIPNTMQELRNMIRDIRSL